MRLALLLLGLAFVGCAASAPQCDPGLPLVNATLWIQSSAEYRAAALQTYAAARMALDDAMREPSPLPPAVILDLDETALDNSQFAARQLAKGERFTFGEAWTMWVSESASTAVPGAVEFAQYAQSRGVTPFYVTSRLAKHEAATRVTLEKLGFPLAATEDTLLVRGERPEWSASTKEPRRQFVSSRYRVLVYLGDAMGDFPSEPPFESAPWGRRWFVVPNPMYGSWEKVSEDDPCGLSRFAPES